MHDSKYSGILRQHSQWKLAIIHLQRLTLEKSIDLLHEYCVFQACVWLRSDIFPPLERMAVSTEWVTTWCGAVRLTCRCTAWALRLLRHKRQFHMTLAGGFRCHGDISFFLHQGWLVIWVKVILLPPSLYSPRLGKNMPPSDKVTHTPAHITSRQVILLAVEQIFVSVVAAKEFLVLYLLPVLSLWCKRTLS